MRQAKDPKYAKLLQKSTGKQISHADFDLLQSWFLSTFNINLLKEPRDKAMYIVPQNKLKCAMNHQMIEHYSKKSNQSSNIVIASNSYKKRPLCNLQ